MLFFSLLLFNAKCIKNRYILDLVFASLSCVIQVAESPYFIRALSLFHKASANICKRAIIGSKKQLIYSQVLGLYFGPKEVQHLSGTLIGFFNFLQPL